MTPKVYDGDLVVQVRNVDNYGAGLTGTYRYLHGSHAIIYDTKTTFGHNLNCECEDGFGWYLNYISDVKPLIVPYDPTQGNEEDDV